MILWAMMNRCFRYGGRERERKVAYHHGAISFNYPKSGSISKRILLFWCPHFTWHVKALRRYSIELGDKKGGVGFSAHIIRENKNGLTKAISINDFFFIFFLFREPKTIYLTLQHKTKGELSFWNEKKKSEVRRRLEIKNYKAKINFQQKGNSFTILFGIDKKVYIFVEFRTIKSLLTRQSCNYIQQQQNAGVSTFVLKM